MCTSLTYTNANGAIYYGRTLELSQELPYQLVLFPASHAFRSETGNEPLAWTAQHAIVAVTMPDRVPAADAPLGPDDFKIVEGMNDAGLTFSLLAYPSGGNGAGQMQMTRRVLSAVDLGSWVLGRFASVAEVKAALAEQPVVLEPLPVLGGREPPFHWVVHDRTGASIVLEFDQGQLAIHDNPVGVMTNGPAFPWHLTNLANYTFLDNRDQSTTTFGALTVNQPDSGIATAGLPSSQTSVGRFVRAVYYSQFAEKVSDPDASLGTLAHIMNNFDRPRGITIDAVGGAGERMDLSAFGKDEAKFSTEFTSWTSLSDLERTRFHLRTYASLNYATIDLARLAGVEGMRLLPLATLDKGVPDATDLLAAAKPVAP